MVRRQINRRRNRRPRSNNELSPWRGPIRLQTHSGLDAQIHRTNLSQVSSFSSTAGGIIASYENTQNVQFTTDWAAVGNLFQEYRVLGLQLHWEPHYNDTYSAALAQSAGAISVDHGPVSSSPISLDEVTQVQTYRVWKSGKPLTLQWRARGSEELQWVPTSTTNNQGGFRWYISGLTNLTLYGKMYYTYLVEFRSRK